MVTSILRVVKSVLGNAQHRPDRRAKDLEGTTLCFAGGKAELRPERARRTRLPGPRCSMGCRQHRKSAQYFLP
jgi:hypothetical protein